ncbi:unnamed protein product [Effrenium voratum]|nr:unnamed protein product [Effrenium voratum]
MPAESVVHLCTWLQAREEFSLGRGEVIRGWDLGVKTMKKGEVATFTLAPEFAYGDEGSPPKIPAKATLVFEVELIGWISKDDLFGDEGAIKTQLKEGSGWKTPNDGDEVLMSLCTKAADGSVLEEKPQMEYVLASGALGDLGKVADRVLQMMKKGEEVSVACTQEYFGKPDGGTVELTLHEIYDDKDVSFGKDKSVMKKQVKEGEGYESPKDGGKVKLTVDVAGSTTTLEFTVGDGEVCDALECAVLEMKKGERAILTCTRPSSCIEPKLSLQPTDKVVMTLELLEFEKLKEQWDLSEEEKVERGQARKEVGGNLFKQGRIELALERYKKVMDLFNYIDNFKDENKAKAKELKKLCDLNKAACHLKLKQHQDAMRCCNNVLKEEADNMKALFRRAQAAFGLYEYTDCMKDIKHILELDPSNRDAKVLYKQAQVGQKEEDKKVKGMFAKMCQGMSSPPQVKAAPKAEMSSGNPEVEE